MICLKTSSLHSFPQKSVTIWKKYIVTLFIIWNPNLQTQCNTTSPKLTCPTDALGQIILLRTVSINAEMLRCGSVWKAWIDLLCFRCHIALKYLWNGQKDMTSALIMTPLLVMKEALLVIEVLTNELKCIALVASGHIWISPIFSQAISVKSSQDFEITKTEWVLLLHLRGGGHCTVWWCWLD